MNLPLLRSEITELLQATPPARPPCMMETDGQGRQVEMKTEGIVCPLRQEQVTVVGKVGSQTPR